MPIERDGRHWCNPASETPDESSQWVCACGKSWTYLPVESTWLETDGVEAYLQMLEEARIAQQAEEG